MRNRVTTYTVKQLAGLAGVTVRTLHYYDEIGLLKPSALGDNGYRRYDGVSVFRLQQILFYRELGLSLSEIRELLDQPEFDILAALRSHRQALQSRATRLSHLIHTIDKTIAHLQGQTMMSNQELFEGFDDETQARYEQEAAQRYDPAIVQASSRRWKNYPATEKARIKAEGAAVYQALLALLDRDPAHAEVQAAVGRWHQHLRAFYEPTPAILRGLGHAYSEQPEFAAFFEAMHPDLPAFLTRAIEWYVETISATTS